MRRWGAGFGLVGVLWMGAACSAPSHKATSPAPSDGGPGDSGGLDSAGPDEVPTDLGCLLLGEEEDEGLDGLVDLRIAYSYDALGNLAGFVLDFESETDGLADGRPDETWAFGYLGTRLLWLELDRGADGERDERREYGYDAAGQLIEERRFRGDGGVVSAVFAYSYDAFGNLVGETEDQDADGDLELVIQHTYLEHLPGEFLLHTTEEDEEADGSLQRRETRSYDGAGQLIRIEADEGADADAGGFVESRLGYEYDLAGNMSRELEESQTGDGIWTMASQTQYFYDERALELVRQQDADGDGQFELAWTFAYGEQDELLVLERDDAPEGMLVIDGIPDARTRYRQDCAAPYEGRKRGPVDLRGLSVPEGAPGRPERAAQRRSRGGAPRLTGTEALGPSAEGARRRPE